MSNSDDPCGYREVDSLGSKRSNISDEQLTIISCKCEECSRRQIKAMEKDIRDLKVERDSLLSRLSAARERIAELERGWIPVSEKLPANYEQVLACLRPANYPRPTHVLAWSKRGIWFGNFTNFDGTVESGEIPEEEVTHWRPLPSPPAESEQSEGMETK